jgi:hypothetical protein
MDCTTPFKTKNPVLKVDVTPPGIFPIRQFLFFNLCLRVFPATPFWLGHHDAVGIFRTVSPTTADFILGKTILLALTKW